MSLDALYTTLFENGALRRRVIAALVSVSDILSDSTNATQKRKRIAARVVENPMEVSDKFFRAVALHPTIRGKGNAATDNEIVDVVTELYGKVLERE